MDIKREYRPILRYDRINKQMVFIIIPTKLSNMTSLAWFVASKKADNGASKEYKMKIGLKNLK